ncbi:hypothetical protein ATEIFO6365_0001008100 [Aspergillus terreus]|uniref:Uncharacterized protein n=1 Tax=Aspergillus terreus TaxID=33178 RepID=A0A5M3YKW4_ASPTE|nr:hypothetical protein ATETN484_0001008000 [Aspergillus terreus]GFF11861.1 hypothetical protein ATEIFO6365_0001008100 [Aspergillus terreus]
MPQHTTTTVYFAMKRVLTASALVVVVAGAAASVQAPLQAIDEPSFAANDVLWQHQHRVQCPALGRGNNQVHEVTYREREIIDAAEEALNIANRRGGDMCPAGNRGVDYPKRYSNHDRLLFDECDRSSQLCEFPVRSNQGPWQPGRTAGPDRVILQFEGTNIRKGRDVKYVISTLPRLRCHIIF